MTTKNTNPKKTTGISTKNSLPTHPSDSDNSTDRQPPTDKQPRKLTQSSAKAPSPKRVTAKQIQKANDLMMQAWDLISRRQHKDVDG